MSLINSLVDTKQVVIEIIHLCCDQNKQLLVSKNGTQKEEELKEVVVRQLKYHLKRRLEEEIDPDISLDVIEFDEKFPNFRYYYEEKGLFRLRCGLTFNTVSKTQIKKFLNKICTNQLFSNTWFGLIDYKSNVLRYLSANKIMDTRVRIQAINSFSFGTLVDLTNFVEHYSSYDSKDNLNVAKDDIIADFQSDERSLDLIFRVTSGGTDRKHMKNIRYKLEYSYKAINSIVFTTDSDSKVMRIYVSLSQPPLLYKVAFDAMTSEQKIWFYRKYCQIWDKRLPPNKQKVYDIIEKKDVHTYDIENNEVWIRDNQFYGCDKDIIGKCNVLMIELPLIVNQTKAQQTGNDKFDPFRLLSLIKRFTRIPIYFAHIGDHKRSATESSFQKFVQKFSDKLKTSTKLKRDQKYLFAINYAFLSLFSFNYLPFDELFLKQKCDQFIDSVFKYADEEKSDIEANSDIDDRNAIEDTLFEMSQMNDRNTVYFSINALNYIFNEFNERNKKCRKEKIIIKSYNNMETDIVYIRQLILTPTRLIMLPPQPTLKSRFISEYETEFTLRLSIREDNLESLQYSVKNHKIDLNSILHRMIKEPLLEGIIIGDRVYEFLGSSTSQLRDTGLILYAKDSKGHTAESIRESIGDLSDYKRLVAKYVARLGLAFSQVITHITVEKCETEVSEDIEIYENNKTKYTFSDGIGRVSKSIMERVYEDLKYTRDKYRPSAMQIRYGGCKGMLVIDPTIEGNLISFRKSMSKYKSVANKLGVIKLSAPRPLYLNRPFITILSQMGIDDKVFLEMLLENLKLLSNAMICECSAVQLLQASSTLRIPYRQLFKSEIPFLSETLFRQIIDSVINHRINELKLKSRIKVPMNSGRTLFGVLDETATLEYGEVFVQLSDVDEDNNPVIDSTFILEGEIMVTKFPCLHPGDVRKFKAVDVENLHHIKDCIVFPQKGVRPHPDEMAGSDLDGDEYAVVWNSPLIFERPNEPPMNFPSSDPTELDHDITVETVVEDILDFYCNYIISNNVGLIASAHLAKADSEKDGIFSEVCMSLAKKYSTALDFAKTGITETISPNERPFLYPDFMDKFAHKRTQLSRKILGQLYRHCDRIRLGIESNKNLEITTEPNKSLKIEGYETYLENAKKRYNEYKMNIEDYLSRFKVDSEATLLSGSFTRTSKYMSGRSESNDVHELLETLINKMFSHFKDKFNRDSIDDSPEQRKMRASAWYMVPFESKEQSNKTYFGFSWTITEELCDLFKLKQNFKTEKGDHNCFEFAAKIFDNYFEDNYIYREPVIEDWVDIKERRQLIMEKRCQTAEVVIRAWLERQDHLFFKRRIHKRLVSSTDSVLSDMDRKLRRKLLEIRVDILSKARDTDEPLKSTGLLVMSFFKNCVDNWFNPETLDDSNKIVDTPLIKLGFSSLITLNHFFKTRDISHIIYLGRKFKISLSAPIRDEVFYISLPVPNPRAEDKSFEVIKDKFTQFLVQRPEEFIEKLRQLSGAIDIYLTPRPLKTKQLRHFYLLTVTGTVWSIQTVKNFICHPAFKRIVADCEKRWRKPNFRPKTQNL